MSGVANGVAGDNAGVLEGGAGRGGVGRTAQ